MEGTWDLRVTLRDCQTGGPLKTFCALSTFGHSGTLIETYASEIPSHRSVGQGTWRHIGGRDYAAVLRFFRFHPDGTFAETEKVTQRIQLSADGNEFTATASIEVYDPDDTLIKTDCATETAKRLE
jgi:hypothetical protein